MLVFKTYVSTNYNLSINGCLIINRPPAGVSTNLYRMLDILNCMHLHRKYKKKPHL